jgi:hypothetical protein
VSSEAGKVPGMTVTSKHPLDDTRMWRKLIAVAHRDAGGDDELCIFAQAVRDAVCSPPPRTAKEPQRPTAGTTDRVPFDSYAVFEVLTDRVVTMADAVAEPYGYLLRQLVDCYPAQDGPLHDQQRRGASYKRLAAIGHQVGMSKEERIGWYRVAETIPLSDRHAGHILSRLKRAA